MKLAVTTSAPNIQKAIPVSLLSGDFQSRVQKASQFGYDGIELIVNNLDDLDPTLVHAAVTRCGLEIAAIATGGLSFLEGLTIISSSKDATEAAVLRLEALIEFAAQVHAPVVTLGSFRGKCIPGAEEEGRSTLKSALRRCSRIAESKQVKIAVEPLNRYESNYLNTVDEVLDFLDDLDSPAAGVLFDTYHANIEEKSLPGAILKAHQAGRLAHVHIGDSNRLPPGFGHIDFLSIFAALASIDYPGFISAELLGKPDPDQAAAATAEFCRPYLKH